MQSCNNVQITKKVYFLRYLDYLQFIGNFHQQSGSKNVQVLKNQLFVMFRLSADLQFKCIFHKQPGSGSESGSDIKVKAGSGSGRKKNSDPQHWQKTRNSASLITLYTAGVFAVND
jgi:hypothetical protein